ncbi:hypothetical protein K431DRAFT_226667 [Polychaeton citri CBS 116435]|uniref:BZIP transcription factor n=1 Tax=Polychaeton citri CBS 116435 TaxID=1314669 RepID=A0A9P4ULP2_9PEZI|nr:hypothetical protein K431DRAFT_226667 [Polychaeton citri CBS 116435]
MNLPQPSVSPLSASGASQHSTPIQQYPPPPQPATNGSVLPPYVNSDVAATAAAALSQQHDHLLTPSNTIAGRKRRAPGLPGSRGVANLTPEQLHKKRANDREAQRAIRERTKTHIESLEARIRELENQQPYQELQHVIRERDAARAESEDLRQRLAAVVGLAGGAVNNAATSTSVVGAGGSTGGLGLNELAALTAQQSPLPPLPQQSSPSDAGARASASPFPRPPDPDYGVQQQAHLHPDLRSSTVGISRESPTSSTGAGPTYQQRGEGTTKHWSPKLEANAEVVQQPLLSLDQHNSTTPQGPAQFQQRTISDHRPSPQALQDHELPNRSSLLPGQEVDADSMPAYTKLPVLNQPNLPLDTLLQDFLSNSRRLLKDGVSMEEVIGPEYPSLANLSIPSGVKPRKCHPLSSLLIGILERFPDLSQTPERVAAIYIMFLILRWLVCPCEHCYYRLPEWIRPSSEQLEVEHGAWIDHLPWPTMRRSLTLAATPGTAVDFHDFFVPYTTTLSLNWPYGPDSVFAYHSNTPPSTDNLQTVSPAFEAHLRDLHNWSLGPRFVSAHPDLCDGVRIEQTRMGYE